MVCGLCGGLVTWTGPWDALTHTECHDCGAVGSQIEHYDDEDDEKTEDEQTSRQCSLADAPESEPRLMEIEAGWAPPRHPSSTVEVVLARVRGRGVSANERDAAMADLWPAFQQWVEKHGWPDGAGPAPCPDCARLREVVRELDGHIVLIVSMVKHEREHGRTRRGMDTAMSMALASCEQARAALTPDRPAGDECCPARERALRTAVIDVLCSSPPGGVGKRLRRGLVDARDDGAHPEDRCEECRVKFDPWHAPPDEWRRVTGRAWGGPILCRQCYRRRVNTFTPDRSTDEHEDQETDDE